MRKKTMHLFSAATISAIILAISSGQAAAQYRQVNLVGDSPGMAAHMDANLKDPWGLAFVEHGPFIVANKNTGVATIYLSNGQPLPFTVTVPAASNQPPGTPGSPTGLVINTTSDFVISKNGRSRPARLIFDTLDGLICGWNPEVDLLNAVVIIDNSAMTPFPASYTALALGRNSSGQHVLYAADSGASLATSNNQVFMYDGKFNQIGHFGDPGAPADKTVFGVQNIDGNLYVTYAAFTLLDGGLVDIFDTDGHLLKQFAENPPGGPLEEPWAVVRAPENFGKFGKALLIGNLGDGRISAFDRATGNFLGQLTDNAGVPISSGEGLWALAFRADGSRDEDNSQLYFTSGVNFEADGLFGFIVATDRKD
jgi:uncharacterized protein (TIGR03118 family)